MKNCNPLLYSPSIHQPAIASCGYGTLAGSYPHCPNSGHHGFSVLLWWAAFLSRGRGSLSSRTSLTDLAGSILGISFLAIPTWLIAPSPVLVRQWQVSFDRGKIINPAIDLVSVVAYSYLAYSLYGTLNHPKAEMYGLSAVATLGIFPYTIFGMMSTNRKLLKKHDEMKGLDVGEKATEVGLARGESVKELVDKWGMLNVGRGLFPLVGAVLGLWSTLA